MLSLRHPDTKSGRATLAVSFQGADFPQERMLPGVRWSGADPWRTRHGAERMRARGVHVAHSPRTRLTKGGFLKNDMASRLAAYCGKLQNPQPQGGKPCFAKPVSTNG
jgi:hypothetical protein